MMKLYTYWRSSAAYRVRIALNLKGIEYRSQATHLAAAEHLKPEYLRANPQGLVPALEHNGEVLFQSLAIIEYLDHVAPEPRLLPENPLARARVAGMAQAVACEIHPLNNLRVLNYLRGELQQGDAAVKEWYAHWVQKGFEALESWAEKFSTSNRFLYGDAISMADVCLVPQMYNARRFNVELRDFPNLVAIDAHLQTLPAVVAAGPERQPDAG
jgi:maleylacetoacetate isomerase